MRMIVAMAAAFIIGAFAMWAFPVGGPPTASAPEPRIGAAEVTDLIDRLKPFAYEPDSAWRGVKVTFTGGGVSVELKTKNGNEYNGKAKTLRDAVGMIADPAPEIRDALKSWAPAS